MTYYLSKVKYDFVIPCEIYPHLPLSSSTLFAVTQVFNIPTRLTSIYRKVSVIFAI